LLWGAIGFMLLWVFVATFGAAANGKQAGTAL
jgi:hypothetical protein